MSVLAFGLSYRSAPVELLERAAVPAEQLAKALRSLTDREHVSEAVVLSTCNRVEVYAHVTRYHGGVADVRDFFCEWAGVAPEDLVDHTYDCYDDRAAAHLFAVTAGLDSMVVGERQVHLQVKQAFRQAQDEGRCGRVLQALFRQALRVGKRARVETGISEGAASMVDVGLDAAEDVLGTLAGRSVLVVGAGKMGGMAAARLMERAGRVVVANRTAHRAAALAARIGAEVADFGRLSDALAEVDLVLASTGAPSQVVDREQVARAMTARSQHGLVLVDLAMPRDVDPGCAELPGVTVLDIDDIRRRTHGGRTGLEVERARDLVDAEVARFAAWTRTVAVEPTIVALRRRAEDLRAAEVDRAAGRLADLDDDQRDAVEQLTRSLVNRLLHDPSVRLKAIADARGGDLHANALRELFDLDL